MDEADRADAEQDSALKEARYRAQQQALLSPALRPRGTCHYCDEDAVRPLLFCSVDCQQDFENEEEALKRMGRR